MTPDPPFWFPEIVRFQRLPGFGVRTDRQPFRAGARKVRHAGRCNLCVHLHEKVVIGQGAYPPIDFAASIL